MALRKSLAGLGAALVLLGACSGEGSDAGGTAATPAMPTQIEAVTFGLNSDVAGERLYGRECAYCHVGRNTGTTMLGKRLPEGTPAQLHERTDLAADYVKIVVRNGMVNMPPLSRAEVSDEELEQIARWLAKEPAQ